MFRNRASKITGDKKYCDYWRFIYCIGIMWMVNNWFRGEKKCFGSDACKNTNASYVRIRM